MNPLHKVSVAPLKISYRVIVIFIFLLAWISKINAYDLIDAMHDGYQNDPVYQNAKATYQDQKQNLPLSTSSLLPQINALTGETETNFSNTPLNLQNDFIYSLDLTETLFSYSIIKGVLQANSVVQGAYFTLIAAEQDLLSRVTQAYFNAALNEDLLEYTHFQVLELKYQLDATKELFKYGYATIADLNQAQASYESILSDEVNQKITLQDSLYDLSKITGTTPTSVEQLKWNIPKVFPTPFNKKHWVDVASTNNFTLRAALANVEAAHQQIGVAKGQFTPSVAISSSYGNINNSNSLILSTTPNAILSYAVTVNMNLSSGGHDLAQWKQYEARYFESLASRNQAYLNAVAEVQKAYQSIVNGVQAVSLSKAAVVSNGDALRNTQKTWIAGTSSLWDVLQSQTSLFSAQKSLTQTRAQYVINLVLIKEAAGNLTAKDLKTINAWLTSDSKKALHIIPPPVVGSDHEDIKTRQEKTSPVESKSKNIPKTMTPSQPVKPAPKTPRTPYKPKPYPNQNQPLSSQIALFFKKLRMI